MVCGMKEESRGLWYLPNLVFLAACIMCGSVIFLCTCCMSMYVYFVHIYICVRRCRRIVREED